MAETGPKETAHLSVGGHSASVPSAGLSFVDDAKLHPDFRCLKGNKMYFVEHCNYYEHNGARAETRIFALTPDAFFVIDFLGVMEHATTYERITEVYRKKLKDKKLLGFLSAEHHILLKVSSEMDCHVSFHSASALQRCLNVLGTLLEMHRGSKFNVKEVSADKEIELYCNDQKPAEHYTPREVAEINRHRIFLEAYICGAKKELGDMQNQVQQSRVRLAIHENAISELKQKGVDEVSVRQRREKAESTQMQLHKKMLAKQEECEDVMDVVRQLQEELIASEANKNALVDKAVTEMMAKARKKHEDAVAMRRRMQQKEKNTMEEEVIRYKNEVFCERNSDQKTRVAEERIATAFMDLEKELEAVFRLEKFLATVNSELGACSDRISALNAEKHSLISAHKNKTLLSPTAADVGAVDSILGSSVAVAAVNSGTLNFPLDDDDLL